MKAIYYIAALLLLCCFVSCEKAVPPPPASSSLTIVNAISGSGTLIPNFNGNEKLTYYISARQIPASGFVELGGYLGDFSVAFSALSDTTHTLLTQKVHVDPSSINTLFLTGSLSAPDYLYTTDKVTATKDSLILVRFVNLSTGSKPVDIDLQDDQGNQGASVQSSLAYKAITGFKPFATKTITPASSQYTFEFRNHASGEIVATYTLSPLIPDLVFKSMTIALIGTPDDGSGNGTQQAIFIPNY